jgi:hypothetical protein
MPSSLNGTGVTFNDTTTLQSGNIPTANLGSGTANNTTFLRGDKTWQTISTSPTTGQVLTATAGASSGAVGTYAFVNQRTSGTTAFGSTRAGSSLFPCGIDQNYITFTMGSSLSGTWRCMGDIPLSGYYITLFLRIS